jgi:hypothetical protein
MTVRASAAWAFILPVAATGYAADATAPATDSLTVVAGHLDQLRNQITPSLGATTYTIGQEQIVSGSQGANAPFNQVLLRAPGVAQDSYGQVHVRGEHANLQYRINGILLPEGIAVFGQELDTRFVDSLRLIDGALPAQYGQRTAGVVDIQTKTGTFDPGGDVGVYGGSFDTIRPHAEYGATIGRTDVYGTASFEHSQLGIENPTSSDKAVHDDTEQYRGFGYGSYLIDPTSRLSLIVSGSQNRFQIPDNPGQAENFTLDSEPGPYPSGSIDDVQIERGYYAVLAYLKTIGPADVQVAAFTRRSAIDFRPDVTGDLLYLGEASAIDQSAQTTGAQVDGSIDVGADHTLRGGGFYTTESTRTGSANEVFPVDGDGNQTSGTPIGITDDNRENAWFTGVYLQDEWRVVHPLTIDYGLRYDQYSAYVEEGQLSPRVNATLALESGTTIHAGYARYFTPPPVEDVLSGSLTKFAGTTNQPAMDQDDPVRAERSNYLDAGVTQQVIPELQVGLDGYYKKARNQIDNGQFGHSLIITPFNYRYGTVYGTEFTTTFSDGGFSAYANEAYSVARATQIESAQFEFDPDEFAYIANHTIYVDHDQRWTTSAGAYYKWQEGTLVFADLIGGSGLRRGFANSDKMPSYVTVNSGASQTWRAFTARFEVVNVFDRVYELRDGSGVGVGAPQYGQRRGFYGGMDYSF